MEQQHPLFLEYRRDFLHRVTRFSKGYLSRVATGKTPLTRSFISQVCYKLNRPEEELFLPGGAEARLTPSQSPTSLNHLSR